jgi:Holliday junction resolvase-like predicted endonuclease
MKWMTQKQDKTETHGLPKPRHQKALQAEERVAEALKRWGFSIKARRTKIRGVEVDIIAMHPQTWESWIVEVKTCQKGFEHFISTKQKQRQKIVLQTCIECYPKYHWRAVLALVYKDKTEWIWDYLN